MAASVIRLHAPLALLTDGWRRDVLFEVGADGLIDGVAAGVPCPAGAERAAGPVIPGMPNLHSHAFQRALAGLAERLGPDDDGFWTWREAMYGLVARLGPDDLQVIARWLYVEMLEAGYTRVAEFHYLHHDPAGRAYADPAETGARIAAAAAGAGIGLTLLPVLYAHGDFGGAPAGPGQRRFLTDRDGFARLLDATRGHLEGLPDARVGVALHSLRAVSPELAAGALEDAASLDPGLPVHVHVAEQPREVRACLDWSGRRPVSLLLDDFPVDARWCLVHATHVDAGEVRRIAHSGAVVGLCPTTEANLGDGLFPAADLLEAGGALGVGSDSQVTVSPAAELRLLEYGQRLAGGRHAVRADRDTPSPGRRLWAHAATHGARALGVPAGALAAGSMADLVVLDPDWPLLAGRDGDALLDTLVFCAGAGAVRDVMVGGRWRVRQGRHPGREAAAAQYRRAVQRLRAGA